MSNTSSLSKIVLLENILKELSKLNGNLVIPDLSSYVTYVDLATLLEDLRTITIVDTYNDLPLASDFTDSFYWVSNSQGISWLPGSLGGTYYPKGIYYSNGVSWEYIETPYQATQLEVNTGTNNDKFVTPLALNNYDKWDEKLDVSALPSNLVLYATTTTSDISGYNKIVINVEDVGFDNTAVNVSTGAITTTGQLISSLATEAGIIQGNVGAVNISTVGNIRRVSGSGSAEFYYEVYHRNISGLETLVAMSLPTLPVTSNTYEQFFAIALVSNIVFLPTDRIVIKYYANRKSGGSNPTYEFQFGGSLPVRTLFPAPFETIGYIKSEVDTLLNTKEDLVNKVTDFSSPDSTTYPTTQAVIDELNKATFTVDLSVDLTVDFYAPYDLRINSVSNIFNAPTTTITVNSGSYTLGNLIDQGDMITVDVDVNGVINLNVVYE